MLEQPKYDFDISRKRRDSGFNFRSGTIVVGIINMILLAPAGIIMGFIFYAPFSHFYFIQQGARTDQARDTLNGEL
ncbi:unnamed protein product [Notodromas monacha]|uniref:Uncharacterized protein n=1 Tax=Notodromas monacha TaxID=399045 RepID=A0A7R9BFS0_9CRUS|nr:unnamed protein product [Notodromas monacha]CAG0914623.1 unnamed protein product [Notodromas monacha]